MTQINQPLAMGIRFWVGLLALVGATILIGGSFYWFEYRPAQIRSQCSWTTDKKPDIPPFEGKTQEQADKENAALIKKCAGKNIDETLLSVDTALCNIAGKIAPKPSRAGKQGEEYVRVSTEKEYTTCLRHNGLK